MTKHGENIVDLLGSEVDRIEANLKVLYGVSGGTETSLAMDEAQVSASPWSTD